MRDNGATLGTPSVTSTTKLFFHMVLMTLVIQAICDPLAELWNARSFNCRILN